MSHEKSQSPGPCIKGSAFDSVLGDVRALLEAGQIPPEQLETRLEPPDLAYLDEKINVAAWYPIGSYTRWLELLCDLEAEGQPEAYLMRRGAIAADRLRESGLYPMLNADCERLGLRALRLFTTIAQAIYNFTEWRGEVDEPNRRFTIFVDEAEEYPDVARFAADGFLARGAGYVTGQPVEVWSERAREDQVIFYFKIGI